MSWLLPYGGVTGVVPGCKTHDWPLSPHRICRRLQCNGLRLPTLLLDLPQDRLLKT